MNLLLIIQKKFNDQNALVFAKIFNYLIDALSWLVIR